jgi:hypothetical protein
VFRVGSKTGALNKNERMKSDLMILAILLTSLTACVREKHEKELAEINALRLQLSGTDSLLLKTDLEFAERMAAEIKNNTQFIQFNLHTLGDTMDLKTYTLVSNYGSLLPAFEKVAENHKHLATSIDSTNKSLDNLAHDLEKNSLAKNLSPDWAVQHEKEQVSSMYEFAGEMRSSLNRAKNGYDTLSPKIAAYIKFLNQKLADKQGGMK